MNLKRESMRDRVKQILFDRIINGTYKPGDRLVELQIARELDTSQAPGREALRELEAMGVVESEAYRGTRVRRLSVEELRESYQVRGVLEEMAASLAAVKFRQNPEALQAVQTAFFLAAEAKNLEQFTQYNTAFHRLIVETSGNRVLLQVWDSLNFEVWTRINLLIVKQKEIDWRSPVKEHEAILDALVQGDGKTAGELLRQHAENVLTAEHAKINIVA